MTLSSKQNCHDKRRERGVGGERERRYILVGDMALICCFLDKDPLIFILHWAPQIQALHLAECQSREHYKIAWQRL